jgi:hypothetical protein
MSTYVVAAGLAASLLVPTSAESAPLLEHWEVVRMIEQRQGDVRAIRDLDCHRLARDRIRCRFIYVSRGRARRCGTIRLRKLEVRTQEPPTPAEPAGPLVSYRGLLGPCTTSASRDARSRA